MIDETVLNLNLQTFVMQNIHSRLQTRVKHVIQLLIGVDPWTKTVKDLVMIPLCDIAMTKGAGKLTIRNIEESLANFGLHLGMTEAEMFRASAFDTGEDAAIVERTLLALEKMFPCLRFSDMDRVRVKAVVLKANEPSSSEPDFEEYYN